MNTQELRNKIDSILGNSMRVLLPSYWWKRLFHHVADTIDGNEQLIIESFKEFEKKYPDIASRTFYITLDENSEEAAHNVQLCQRFFINLLTSLENGIKFHNDPYYLAIPATEEEEALEYDVRLITCPQYSFAEGGIAFWDVGIGEKQYIVLFFILGNGIPEIAPLSGSTNITVDSSLSTSSTNPVQNKVVTNALNNKQTTLVSGSNIKTINNQSILGSGNLVIETGGNITIDSAMSSTSVNPVQNKVIKAYVDDNLNDLTEEIITNEEVHAAALNDLNARIKELEERLKNAGL